MLNKYLSYTFILFALTLLSCEDVLEKEPITELDEVRAFETEADARRVINGIYDPLGYGENSPLQDPGFAHSYEFIFGDICTDDSEKGSIVPDLIGITFLKDFIADGTNRNIETVWAKYFVAIYRSNLALKNLQAAPLDPEVIRELQGEARFVRAFSYLSLVQVYGGLPLFSDPVTPEQLNTRSFSKAPIYEVYELIDADFTFAKNNLPEKGVREVGRANAGAAAAFLARSIMYQIGTDNTNGYEWSRVLNLTDSIIDGQFGNYALAANYATLFEEEGENNIESIFEVQAVDNGVDPFDEAAYTGSEWTIVQTPLFMGGWGFNTPTENLAMFFENNDPRRHATAIGIGEYAYGVEMVESARNRTGYYPRKAITRPGLSSDLKITGQNTRKFRYADILLMNAEAAYYEGAIGQARDRVIEIRNRASQSTFPRGFIAGDTLGYAATGFAPLSETVIPADGQDLLEFIWDERRRELSMEQLRFMELVRTGRYVDVMNGIYGTGEAILNHSITSQFKEDNDQVIVNPIPVFPIPVRDAVGWGITQNRNY